jgi:hypothetical protein
VKSDIKALNSHEAIFCTVQKLMRRQKWVHKFTAKVIDQLGMYINDEIDSFVFTVLYGDRICVKWRSNMTITQSNLGPVIKATTNKVLHSG